MSRKLYDEYLEEIDRRNFDIDMYDGDTYLPGINPMTYEEWCEDYDEEQKLMDNHDKEQFMSDIYYFWTEKGDIERFTGYSIEKLREIDPVIAEAYERMKIAKETFSRLIAESYDRY